MSVITTDIHPTRMVRDLAVELPNATRVFERFGIDYCCGGKKPLGEVCQAANLNLDEVLKSLDKACRQESPINDTVLQSGSLGELIDHIVKTHHKFTRDEIVTLQALATKVCSVHG